MKSDYMPGDDEGKATLLIRFRDNIGALLAALGLLPADPDIVQQAADAARFRAVVDFAGSMQKSAQAWAAEKNYQRDGGDTAPSDQNVPVLPASFPPAVPPGIDPPFRALVRRLNGITAFSEAMAQQLSLVGAEQTAPDLDTIQPDFTAVIRGNAVFFGWGGGGYGNFLDMIRLEGIAGTGRASCS